MTDPTSVVAPRWTVYVRLDDVRSAYRNPRKHVIPGIAASIIDHGFTKPVLNCDRTGRVAAGHGAIAALHYLRAQGFNGTPNGIVVDDDGEWCVPVTRGWSSVDDSHLEAYIIQDNKLTENTEWDVPMLGEMMHDLATGSPELFDSLGFDPDEMDKIIGRIDPDRLDLGPPPTKDTDKGTKSDAEYADEWDTTGPDRDPTPPKAADVRIGCPSCGSLFELSEATPANG